MRVLFALPGFHRYDRGAEVALLSVAQALAEAGHDVTVVGSGKERPSKAYRFRHVGAIRREVFERFPFFPPFRSETAWEDATFAVNLLRFYRPADYDAVVTCSFPFTHLALRRLAGKRPLQVYVTQNGEWPAISQDAEYRAFGCDLLVCTNPDYFENNRRQWNCALIPNGVDLSRFMPGPGERERLGLPADGAIVLMVSAFIETKRVMEGIRAVSAIDDAHLVVAGDGPLRSAAQDLAAKLMPDRFHRISLPAEDMPALYRSADAFLHMSLFESFGNVFLEAMASGLPVVAHDTERLRWIVGEKDAFLCDTQDDAALDRALRKALSHGPVPPGEELIRFSWGRIAEDYASAIEAARRNRSVR